MLCPKSLTSSPVPSPSTPGLLADRIETAMGGSRGGKEELDTENEEMRTCHIPLSIHRRSYPLLIKTNLNRRHHSLIITSLTHSSVSIIGNIDALNQTFYLLELITSTSGGGFECHLPVETFSIALACTSLEAAARPDQTVVTGLAVAEGSTVGFFAAHAFGAKLGGGWNAGTGTGTGAWDDVLILTVQGQHPERGILVGISKGLQRFWSTLN